jgi:hypothetical protein
MVERSSAGKKMNAELGERLLANDHNLQIQPETLT